MNNCSKCGKSDEEVRLFDGIYVNEAIKICERCSLLEGVPIIKIPTTGQLKESEKPGRGQIYNRLKRMAGIKEERQSKSIFEELKELETNPELEKPLDTPLKLVDNFYWVIQRERRRKGMTHKQLADSIGESEMAIKLIERNNLPEDAMKMIRKMEQFLRIRLIKPDPRDEERKERIILEKSEGKYVNRLIEDAYTEIILDPCHEKDKQEQLEEDLAIAKIKEAHFEKVREKDQEDNELREVIKQAPPILRKQQKESTQVLSFKKERLNKITISDLQEMNRVVDQDYPTKTSEEIGREQLEDFGKSEEGEEQRKDWYSSYMKKKILGEPRRENVTRPMQPETDNEKIPTIHELMAKKKDFQRDEGIVGDEIEIEEIEEI